MVVGILHPTHQYYCWIFHKRTVSEPVKYVEPVFFPWTIFFNLAILCEIKLLQSLFDQQYINVGQIYNIQPQGLVETLMILLFLSLCVYLVSWYQGRLTGTKVCPEWQVKNISFPPSSGTVIFSCTHTIKCPSPKKNCTST